MADATNIPVLPEGGEQPVNTTQEAIKIQKLDGAVNSVNGMEGDVVLTAQDVGALPDVPDTLEPYAKKSDLAGVAFTGEYEDLLNEPQDFSQEDWDLLWSID